MRQWGESGDSEDREGQDYGCELGKNKVKVYVEEKSRSKKKARWVGQSDVTHESQDDMVAKVGKTEGLRAAG